MSLATSSTIFVACALGWILLECCCGCCIFAVAGFGICDWEYCAKNCCEKGKCASEFKEYLKAYKDIN